MKIFLFVLLATISLLFFANLITYLRIIFKINAHDAVDWWHGFIITAFWVVAYLFFTY